MLPSVALAAAGLVAHALLTYAPIAPVAVARPRPGTAVALMRQAVVVPAVHAVAVHVLAPISAPTTNGPPPDTGWPALDAAIERIPGYAATAPVSWQVSSRYGHAGSTLLPAEAVYISPSVPLGLLDSVVRHEWSHVLQFRTYGGNTAAMTAGLDAAFGGVGPRGVTGVENAADCMALQLGATWTHYTSCHNPRWRAAAALLLAGRPV